MKRIVLATLAFLSGGALFAAEPVKLPPKEKFYLILLTGQSNMAGRGTVAPEDKVPNPRILMQNQKGAWVPAVDPVHYDKSFAGVRGADVRQAVGGQRPVDHRGADPGGLRRIAHLHLAPGKRWAQTESNPYDDAVARAKKAMKDGTLKVILFHQGEGDCGENASKLYHDRLLTLINQLRTDLDSPEVPFIIGQLSKFPGKPWSEAKTRVDAAHQAMTKVLKNVGFAVSDDLTANPDNIHFDAKSQKEFGQRYYKAYQEVTR